ncbi:MAG: glycosyltransferase family 9 protein [bacterium]
MSNAKKWFDEMVQASLEVKILSKRVNELERIVRRLDPGLQKMQILVWRNIGGLGDILMQSPIARGLKEKFPEAIVTYAVPKQFTAIPEHNPYVDKVKEITTPFFNNGYDHCIKLSEPCPCAVYESVRSPNIDRHRIDLFLEGAGVEPSSKDLIYTVKTDEREWAAKFLKKHGARDCFKVGFQLRSITPLRDWELANFKVLAKLIKKKFSGTKIFIFDADPKMAWQQKEVVDICGYSIPEVAAVMQTMDFMICPDSGLAHLAGALKVPILGIFGPTDPKYRLSTYHKADWIYLSQKFDCMPCWYGQCHDLSCLKAITPEMVLRKMEAMLNG